MRIKDSNADNPVSFGTKTIQKHEIKDKNRQEFLDERASHAERTDESGYPKGSLRVYVPKYISDEGR